MEARAEHIELQKEAVLFLNLSIKEKLFRSKLFSAYKKQLFDFLFIF